MKFNVVSKNGTRQEEMELKSLLVVGFAGKDIEKTMEHIRELEAEGVKCPRKVPVLYQCDPQIVTEKDEIEVIGHKTSGEVEYLILVKDGKYAIERGRLLSTFKSRLFALQIRSGLAVGFKRCTGGRLFIGQGFDGIGPFQEHFNGFELLRGFAAG